MAGKRSDAGGSASLSFKIKNKQKRQAVHIKRKKALESTRRDDRMRRSREEEKNPQIREERLKRNVPITIDQKRVWDEVDRDTGDGLGVSVDVERLKRRRLEDEAQEKDATSRDEGADSADERDSMIDPSSESDDDMPSDHEKQPSAEQNHPPRASSPVQSTTSTNLDLAPETLALRFPNLFKSEADALPKILITTTLNSTLHHEAQLLTALFPFSVYIPRSAHRYSHKYSIREISSFAANRNYTALVVLTEDLKKPSGLDIVHLPEGPTFHFSISNWVEGKKLPGHGRPTEHIPELILNNFRTPLGLLTAHLFRNLFPVKPELQGRQVVTLHNQRDYIFLRRHRYIFREKREREKNVVGPDGKEVKGVEGIRAGLQELGPRFTLKLRRIDKGIQRASGQEWEWKGRMDKARTKFQL